MATKTRDSASPPLQERIVIKNTVPRAIELVILSLLASLLFTFYWILVMNVKWTQCMTKTYPERLMESVQIGYVSYGLSDFYATNLYALLSVNDYRTSMEISTKRSRLPLRGNSHVIVIRILVFLLMSTARTIQLSSRVRSPLSRTPRISISLPLASGLTV
ncbi:hypothetical protein L6452_00771 [Arctium lappa]|uniref:Uncharacterized protein n=1 Tax=Arctium lappa TaxID=4217 RepID=A0ACB9FGA4_ARCLA|nr:hypothetical protein L6452_00771 [Arctium lappa]